MTIIPADVAVNPTVSFGRIFPVRHSPNSPEQKEPASGLFLTSAQMLCLYGYTSSRHPSGPLVGALAHFRLCRLPQPS